METLGVENILAFGIFLSLWLVFEFVIDHSPLRFKSLTGHMAFKRREWMLVMAERDLRMIDTSILTGLQQGAAFFGSACLLGIGGCFALLGATENVVQIHRDLPLDAEFTRGLWDTKVLGLTAILGYSFFKFGWSYRLFNYCSILIGAVPHKGDAPLEERKKAALDAAEINTHAARHFTAGLRGTFFALAYLGWFLGPIALIITTLLLIAVLVRRQFFSYSLKVLSD
ncbi:MAG: DUF599 domain-containing protein [Rhizobiaceae bacterium]